MYLVDTSIWIDYFRGVENPSVKKFSTILDQKVSYGITGVIFQEILQGALSLQDFQNLNEYLSTQRFYHPLDKLTTYQSAAMLYFNCRRKGITIRSTVDCLIAQIAMEQDLVLLHNDADYRLIATVADLKQVSS